MSLICADLKQTGDTALAVAAAEGHTAVVQALLGDSRVKENIQNNVCAPQLPLRMC